MDDQSNRERELKITSNKGTSTWLDWVGRDTKGIAIKKLAVIVEKISNLNEKSENRKYEKV